MSFDPCDKMHKIIIKPCTTVLLLLFELVFGARARLACKKSARKYNTYARGDCASVHTTRPGKQEYIIYVYASTYHVIIARGGKRKKTKTPQKKTTF